MFLTNKAASKRWLTFSVLALLSITACEETNTVGVDFIQESAIQVDTVFIDQINLINILNKKKCDIAKDVECNCPLGYTFTKKDAKDICRLEPETNHPSQFEIQKINMRKKYLLILTTVLANLLWLIVC